MKGNVRESRNFSSVNAAISFISSLSVSQPGLAALMSAISFSISATVLDIISIVLFFMIHKKQNPSSRRRVRSLRGAKCRNRLFGQKGDFGQT